MNVSLELCAVCIVATLLIVFSMSLVRQQLQRQSQVWYSAERRLDAKTLLVPMASW